MTHTKIDLHTISYICGEEQHKMKNSVIDKIINYVYKIEQTEPHSIYLRGSSLTKEIEDCYDIDLTFVYDKLSIKGKYGFKNIDNKWIYDYDLNKLVQEIDIFPECNMMTVEEFKDCIELRYQSKKIYGNEKDLSLSNISIDDLRELYEYPTSLLQHTNINSLLLILDGKVDAEYRVLDRIVKNLIKDFYRDFGVKILLKDGVYDRDLRACQKALLKEVPQYSDTLENTLDLFLNTEKYSISDMKVLVCDLIDLSKVLSSFGK